MWEGMLEHKTLFLIRFRKRQTSMGRMFMQKHYVLSCFTLLKSQKNRIQLFVSDDDRKQNKNRFWWTNRFARKKNYYSKLFDRTWKKKSNDHELPSRTFRIEVQNISLKISCSIRRNRIVGAARKNP